MQPRVQTAEGKVKRRRGILVPPSEHCRDDHEGVEHCGPQVSELPTALSWSRVYALVIDVKGDS